MQWLANLVAPFLDWIQVEVTSHCNADCVYCPHSVFKEFWQDRHMPMDVYQQTLACVSENQTRIPARLG